MMTCLQCGNPIYLRSEIEEVFHGKTRHLLHKGGCAVRHSNGGYNPPQPTRSIPR